jgi:hypothetical protein
VFCAVYRGEREGRGLTRGFSVVFDENSFEWVFCRKTYGGANG